MKDRYCLRKAAGSYWLLDMEQDGKNYRSPLELNESGAKIWELFHDGSELTAAAEYLCEAYDISFDEAKEDTRQFLAGLRAAGVEIG